MIWRIVNFYLYLKIRWYLRLMKKYKTKRDVFEPLSVCSVNSMMYTRYGDLNKLYRQKIDILLDNRYSSIKNSPYKVIRWILGLKKIMGTNHSWAIAKNCNSCQKLFIHDLDSIHCNDCIYSEHHLK